METSKYQQAIVVITKEQEKIIGKNLADQVVHSIASLNFDQNGVPILVDEANPKEILGELVDQYATIFGQASVEVAREAVKNLNIGFSANDLPENLK